MRSIAQGTAAAALVAWFGFTFMPYFNPGNGGGPNLWEATSNTDIFLTILALVGCACLVAGAIVGLRWTAIAGAVAAAGILGQQLPLEAPTLQLYDVGFWATIIAAGIALAAAVTAAVLPEDGAVARAPATAARVAPPAPAAPTAPTPSAPVGWYPDPDGGGGLRLWSGTRWTDEKRSE